MAQSPDIEETLVKLLVSHQAVLNAFVYALLPGHPDADDVVQEVNALVWKKRGEFAIGTSFKDWVFSIARFKVMSLWRDQKRKKVWVMPEETLVSLLEEASSFEEDKGDQRQEALRECIQQLPTKERQLILSRYTEGRSIKEVALALGRNAENLKEALYRIRLRLRSCVLSKISIWGATE